MSDSPIHLKPIEALQVSVYPSNDALGRAAAAEAAGILQNAIQDRGRANAIFATGNSQLTFLAALRSMPGIDWPRVNVFNMDEYIGLPAEHLARFDLFMRRQLVDHVKPAAFHPVPGPLDQEDILPLVEKACRDHERLLRENPADLCACGIGENGHLAFNDPPYADFDDPVWVKVVEIDEASRRQQVGEGHFNGLEEVPRRAITLTIPALLAARHVLCLVPERRKAPAVVRALTGPILEDCPASVLRRAPNARLYLDSDSASGMGW
jgi:glucosamine-6-phosphate deaminase